MKKSFLIDLVFLIVIMLIILVGFIKPMISQIDVISIENREANQLPKFSISKFIDKSIQDNYELAYADQIPFSSTLKLTNNTVSFRSKLWFLNNFDNSVYKKISDLNIVEDCLLYDYVPTSEIVDELDKKITNINKIEEANKNKKFYVFYFETDRDINIENNDKSSNYEYLKKGLNSKIKTSLLDINSLNDYKKYFYQTDHHWNYKGSYEAYKRIIQMILGDSEKVIVPNKLVTFNSIFDGSKARSLGAVKYYNEKFSAYDFTLAKHDYYKNGQKVDFIADTKTLINNNPQYISYGNWYGNDYGLLEYDYKNTKKDNLLILGDSYDNAIGELVASHFNKTYIVDLRHYKKSMDKEFNINEFIKENEIDKILIVGGYIYFTYEDFIVRGV